MIMLSDHGFEKLETNVNISYLLRQEGFLKFQPNQEIRLGNMSAETKAFALDPARIYLHYKDKYPLGGIQRDDVESLLSRLEELFFSLEVNGRKVIKEIYRKSEIYSGPYLQNAPDLILVAEEGFNLKANLRDNQLTNKDNIFTGKHRLDNAFLVVSGNVDNDVILDNPTIADVKTFIEKSSGFLQDSTA
jgi:predicted AlkP superfamily phosphohydrolase/phosphomutase